MHTSRGFFALTTAQMCLVFFTQYLDKQSLAYAAVYGLIDDLLLSDVQYSWLTSGFYLTQLFTEFVFIYGSKCSDLQWSPSHYLVPCRRC